MAGMSVTAAALVAIGRGILAADESLPMVGRHRSPQGAASTVEARRAYRQMLFTAPGVEDSISGAILFEEALRQRSSDGVPFPDLLRRRGIEPGARADAGTVPFGLGEWETEGLDALAPRLLKMRELGARFAKWRAVFRVDGTSLPSAGALATNAASMARFAVLCQEADLVPLIEPELLRDGNHGIERAAEASRTVLEFVFRGLEAAGVTLKSVLLQTAFVAPGVDADPCDPAEIAERTLSMLHASVPWMVPGVAFLSNGLPAEIFTTVLQRIVARADQAPWRLTFSLGRALQQEALDAWDGRDQFAPQGQRALAGRARTLASIVAGQRASISRHGR